MIIDYILSIAYIITNHNTCPVYGLACFARTDFLEKVTISLRLQRSLNSSSQGVRHYRRDVKYLSDHFIAFQFDNVIGILNAKHLFKAVQYRAMTVTHLSNAEFL